MPLHLIDGREAVVTVIGSVDRGTAAAADLAPPTQMTRTNGPTAPAVSRPVVSPMAQIRLEGKREGVRRDQVRGRVGEGGVEPAA